MGPRAITRWGILSTVLLSLTLFRELEAFSVSSVCDSTLTDRHVAPGRKFGGKLCTRRGNGAMSSSPKVKRICLLAARSDLRGGNMQSRNGIGMDQLKNLADKNFFLLGMGVAVALANLYPSLGKNGGLLRPELFIGKFGVTCIFLLSGLSLELSELKAAASNVKLNLAVQSITFGAWPFFVGLPLTRFLRAALPNVLPDPLLDGLLIMTCLPTTVNMCVFLTSASGGNVASSLCNVVFSNLAGIFVTPALLLRFFGTNIQLPFTSMVLKLCNKVLVPVAIGQALRATRVKHMYETHSKLFKRIQEIILLGIVWNAFCDAFAKGLGLELYHGALLLVLLSILHLTSLGVLFKLFELPAWKFSRGDVVSSMFCASHKTLAFGLPLVKTIFEGNPNLAIFCAPIMFIHPLQLVLGSFLVPRLSQYTAGKVKVP